MKPRRALILVFVCILLLMLVATTSASLQQSILAMPQGVQSNVWFQATMCDAYSGFLTFYVWVFYRSPHWLSRTTWFIAIMLLGNIAMAAYALYRLYRWPKPYTAAALLLRDAHAV
jgi:hypothetical protein